MRRVSPPARAGGPTAASPERQEHSNALVLFYRAGVREKAGLDPRVRARGGGTPRGAVSRVRVPAAQRRAAPDCRSAQAAGSRQRLVGDAFWAGTAGAGVR